MSLLHSNICLGNKLNVFSSSTSLESGCKVAVVMNEQMILVYLTLSDWVLQEVASLDPWSRLVQTAPRNRKVQAGVPLDLQVLALDPDEN